MSKRAIRRRLNCSLQAQDSRRNGSARALFFIFNTDMDDRCRRRYYISVSHLRVAAILLTLRPQARWLDLLPTAESFVLIIHVMQKTTLSRVAWRGCSMSIGAS